MLPDSIKLMKKILSFIPAFFIATIASAQVSGNVNYQSQTHYPDNNINISRPSSKDITITVKGLANVKADSYVAIFSVSQNGKTADEVNTLIDKRISQATTD